MTVALSGEEIRRRLVDFAQKWSLYNGSERSEAQTFLNELFECYGSSRRDVGARFEEAREGRFLDLLWPRVCLVEMKRPSEASRLERHRPQALNYWRNSADPQRNIPAPQWAVLCAFRRFEIWEPGSYPNEPRTSFDLIELPDRADTLMFLAGREPVFVGTQEAVTREAVSLMIGLYRQLGDRRAAGPDVLRDFVLQSVWCMFAEDLGQLEGYLFTRLVDGLVANPQRSSADDLGLLFDWLSRDEPRPAGGLYADTRYVNGGLFEHPARVHLDRDELAVLALVCEYDWRKVEPAIFGSLMEGALGHDAQWALGAHYTHEPDIMKVVKPCIVEPWRERIGNATTLPEVQRLQNELLSFVVLDPACGSGNFLYIAYRELRRIERELHGKERQLRRAGGLREQVALSAFFPLHNIRGIEISPLAVALARVTLWMAHKLAVDELDLSERTLPLEHLSGIQVADALRTEWPKASVIIGNPPFHGDRHLRELLGESYLEWLKREFNCGIKDHCVYWFRKAHDHLAPGQHAGLVGTNSVTQNRARSASLDYIVENGGVITNAVSTQPWPAGAVVEVSIVNWVREPAAPPSQVVLDGEDLDEPIAASLRPQSIAVERAGLLHANEGRAFYGMIPGAGGFILEPKEAAELLNGKPPGWREIVRPYLTGDDLMTDPQHAARRWIIDFGHRTLEQTYEFPEALAIVRERVKPYKDRVTRAAYRRNWWRFSEPISELREAIAGLDRYIAAPAQGKRILFSWVDANVCPSNLVTAFAYDDDYAIGILNSFAHQFWLSAGWSSLRQDLRYTASTVFATFPWPAADGQARSTIASTSRQLLEVRDTLCIQHDIGLTKLYNRLDDGAFTGLRDCHHALDRAVAAAYGWPVGLTTDVNETLRRLLARNLAISSGETSYEGPR